MCGEAAALQKQKRNGSKNKPSCTGELHATWLADAKEGKREKKPEEEAEKEEKKEKEKQKRREINNQRLRCEINQSTQCPR